MDKHNLNQAIKSMIRAIDALLNDAEDDKNASKKPNIIQITQVVPLQNLTGSKLKKRGKKRRKLFFWILAEREKAKTPLTGKKKATNWP